MYRLIVVLAAGVMMIAAGAAFAGQHTCIEAVPPVADCPTAAPTHPGTDYDNGYRMYEQGQYVQATRAFRRALRAHPGHYHAAYFAGLCYLQRERYVDARRAFRLAVELGADRRTESFAYSGIAYSYEKTRQSRMAHFQYHLACKSYKANGYAQAGAERTEYRKAAVTKANAEPTPSRPQPIEPAPRRAFGRSSMLAGR